MKIRRIGIFWWLALQGMFAVADDAATLPAVTMYASQGCQTCVEWADYLRRHGFVVNQEEKSPAELQRIKRWLNVPSQLESVQTARVAGYFIEGLVPVNDILRLLSEQPRARGLATVGTVHKKFDTMLVGPDGRVNVFSSPP
jgi:hypothetical protein